MARRTALTDFTVLIIGESGTGKERLARAIHEAGCRPKRSFVGINCSNLPPELILGELFGCEEGAFTGARRGGSAGKFEQASGDSLLLDEIAEMVLALQVNLLRVLEENQLTRMGGPDHTRWTYGLLAPPTGSWMCWPTWKPFAMICFTAPT